MSGPAEAGGLWLIKVYGAKVLAGVAAAALGFAVLWPRNAKEGVGRIAVTIACSAMFGDLALAAVNTYIPWYITADDPTKFPVYAMAGLPGWYVLGWVMVYLDRRRGNDVLDVVREAKDSLK